jgi:DHA1 family tetracycline resistance protein-like MFS transporter
VTDAPHRQPAVKFILLTLFLDVLGFGLLIPVAPRLVAELQGQGTAAAATTYGLLITMYAAMQLVFAPVLGSLSDRFGRRPVILIALFGSGLDYFAMALAPSVAFLFITRAINGISGANFTACNAYIADVTPPEKRAAAFGMVGAAFGLGFIFGPLLGGWLGHMDIRLPFIVAGVLTLLNWLYGCFVLPESLPRDRRRAFSLARANPLGTLTHLMRYPLVLGLSGALFLLNLAMFSLHTTWVLYTAHRYGWDSVQTGVSLALVGVGAAVVQGGLARRIIPALGEPRSLIVGIAIGAVAYAGYGLATQGWMIYAIILVASLGGIAGPAGQAIITKTVLPTEQGEVQGALTSLQSLAQIVAPPVAAGVFAYSISGRAPVEVPGAVYLLSSLLAGLGLVVAVLVLRRWGPGQGAGAGGGGDRVDSAA